MILTGKARLDFLKYFRKRNKIEYANIVASEFIFSCKDELYRNALIIDFFDSVGIFIHPKRFTHCLKFQFWYFIIENSKGVYLFDGRCVEELKNNHIANDSRQEAISKAIEKANEIYNGKHQRNNESK